MGDDSGVVQSRQAEVGVEALGGDRQGSPRGAEGGPGLAPPLLLALDFRVGGGRFIRSCRCRGWRCDGWSEVGAFESQLGDRDAEVLGKQLLVETFRER